jgi:hypothetical protein
MGSLGKAHGSAVKLNNPILKPKRGQALARPAEGIGRQRLSAREHITLMYAHNQLRIQDIKEQGTLITRYALACKQGIPVTIHNNDIAPKPQLYIRHLFLSRRLHKDF